MSATYFKTTPIDAQELAAAITENRLQDELVMHIFRHYRRAMSPSDVFQMGQRMGKQWLITSVRRSMTNLAGVGALDHMDLTKPGPYGRPEGLWRLADSPVQLELVAS